MSDPIVPILLRPAEPGDMGLVYDSWLKSYRFREKDADSRRPCSKCSRPPRREVSGGDANAEIRSEDYFRFQRQRIDIILANKGYVVIAHPAETPAVIAAWACLDQDPNIVHYVYTREAYRERGYARLLVAGRTICTHLTDSRRPDSATAWKRRMGMRYLPYLGIG